MQGGGRGEGGLAGLAAAVAALEAELHLAVLAGRQRALADAQVLLGALALEAHAADARGRVVALLADLRAATVLVLHIITLFLLSQAFHVFP